MIFQKNNNNKKPETEELFNNPFINEDNSENAQNEDTSGKTPLLSEHSGNKSSFETSYEEPEEPQSSTSTHFDLEITSDSLHEDTLEKESLLPNKSKKKLPPGSSSPSHPLSQLSDEEDSSVLPIETESKPDSTNNSNIQTTEKSTKTPQKAPVAVNGGNDGVFANLSAKPQINKPTADPATIDAQMEDGPPNEPLPNYEETMAEPSPPQFDNMTYIPMAADDVLVDHLPVGSIYAFLWSFIVSVMFDWVGFVLTYLLHINHSGRYGSFAGLGCMLIKFGIMLINNPNYFSQTIDNNLDFAEPSISTSSEKVKVDSMMSYIMLVMGFMILFKALLSYHRVIKIRREMLATSTLPI